MRRHPHQNGTTGRSPQPALEVKSDLQRNHPITEEELAVIEAFLLPELLAILDDSKEPQRPAKLKRKEALAEPRR
ncbi:hypothetical protein PZ895_14450 [Mesorhizobium sp. YIM 152430]|uniref:hypothetical protein n=1 Tax=Mesorhizobium sp. YIM 152430 TaxID=3031761 RepID=UPI0023DB6601|nr:hypothetical protein [Mesorhizobium sp. YIM 152430]MDF1600960.1 hypothetical protein [Mesorhizobium sp. YIM 152430]